MPTLFEMMVNCFKEKQDVEAMFYNPFGIRVGNHVKVDTLDYEEFEFSVTGLREAKRPLPDGDRFMCDYDVLAKPFGGEEVPLRLRLVPLDTPDGEMSHNVILLQRVEEFSYEEDFHNSLKEPYEGEYTLFLPAIGEDGNQETDEDGNPVDHQFWRVNDVETEWEVKTAYVSDADNDGTVEESEVQRSSHWLWDYWRNFQDEADQEVTEFYLIEMGEKDGYFECWRGTLVDPDRILVT